MNALSTKRHRTIKTKTMLCALLVACLLPSDILHAATPDNDDMRFFEQEAQVISSSRRPQALRDSPVAIDVITAAEIRASGATRIIDLLRFRAGVDAIDGRSIVGNRGMVSVRGLPQEWAVGLLVLVDGRSVYSPLNGGVYWEQIPVQVQDIERIEIIRGPNAALYGSNAAQGVINIITKAPRGGLAGRTEGRSDNRNGWEEESALQQTSGEYGYRLSQTHQESAGYIRETSTANDNFQRSNKANFHGFWKPHAGLTLDLQSGGSSEAMGAPITGVPNGTTVRNDQHFVMAKLASDPLEESSYELTASRNELNSEEDPVYLGPVRSREFQYDAEGLQRLRWLGERMQTTWGLSYRETVGESDQLFAGQSANRNHIWREFVDQSVKLSDVLSLTVGGSLEQSPLDGLQEHYQAALVATPSKQHSFRASYSRAATSSDFYTVAANERISPSYLLQGNHDIHPTRVYTAEFGYRGSYLDNAMEIDADVYYMNELNVIYLFNKSVQPFPFLLTQSFDNRNSVLARGLEAGVKYRLDGSRSVFANYTYEDITDAKGDVLAIKQTPRHKVNAGAMADLGHGFGAYAVAGYKDHYKATSSITPTPDEIPAYWRLDARLSYAATENVEIFVGGQNLLTSTHHEFADNFLVPRIVEGGVTLTFGKMR